MTGVQTCALPICFPVTIPEAVGVVASKEQQDIDDIFGSLVEGLQEDPKIEEAKKSAKVDIQEWVDIVTGHPSISSLSRMIMAPLLCFEKLPFMSL